MKSKFNRLKPCVQKKQNILFFLSFCFTLFTSVQGFAASSSLVLSNSWTVPMVEISGLSISNDRLYAVSDREHDLFSLPVLVNDVEATRVDGSSRQQLEINIPSSEQAQWEAVSVNDISGTFALKETENKIFHFDTNGRNVKTYQLETWAGRVDASRGLEGIMLMQNGHFLVALETGTAALIEYGPAGEKPSGLTSSNRAMIPSSDNFDPPSETKLVPLAAWTMKDGAGGCRFSDLARAHDGGILILMKDCMKVTHVAELKVSSSTFSNDKSWNVPSSIEHPEGIQAMGDQGVFISSDIQTTSKNLYWLKFP